MFQKVLRAPGKPRHLCDNRDHINQGYVFFFVFLLRVDAFLLKYAMPFCIHFELVPFSVNMLCVSDCLQCSLSPPYLGNARSGPSPSRWSALITLLTLAKFPFVWCRLCDAVLFTSCLVEHTLTAVCVILSRGSSTH